MTSNVTGWENKTKLSSSGLCIGKCGVFNGKVPLSVITGYTNLRGNIVYEMLADLQTYFRA
jgi:hypothetical protein